MTEPVELVKLGERDARRMGWDRPGGLSYVMRGGEVWTSRGALLEWGSEFAQVFVAAALQHDVFADDRVGGIKSLADGRIEVG